MNCILCSFVQADGLTNKLFCIRNLLRQFVLLTIQMQWATILALLQNVMGHDHGFFSRVNNGSG